MSNITPSLSFPTGIPIGLPGGTVSAAQVTAARGLLSGTVRAGSAVYVLLRWNEGLSRWEAVKLTALATVSVEPDIRFADGTASTEFAAIPGSYYTALLNTSQPDGSAANLIGLDIANAGTASGGGSSTDIFPLTRTLFVDSGTTTPLADQDGQEWTAYASETQFAAGLSAMPARSLVGLVIRRASGADFTLPSGQITVLRGEVRLPTLGNITRMIGGGGVSVSFFRNCAFASLTLQEEPGAPPAAVALESASCAGPIMQIGSASTLNLLIGGTVPNAFLGGPVPNASAEIGGDITVTGIIQALNTEFLPGCSQINCQRFMSQGSSGQFDLNIAGTEAEFRFFTWTANGKTITFTGSPGIVYLDADSTYNFWRRGVQVVNGTIAPYVELQSPDWTLPVGVTEGQLLYISGANSLGLAIADDATRVDLYAVFANLAASALLAGSLERYVRFKTGLTLVEGQRWWLSTDEAGSATNVEPVAPAETGNFAAPGGFIRDVSRYAAENLALCSFNPGPVGGPL